MFLTSRQQAPPANWQDFESLCAKLWRHIWQDDNVQRFGRNGQRQQGVDIAGRAKTGGMEGIQCKLKDVISGKALSLAEIKAEIAEAEGFEPPLTRLTFATTAAPDVALQREVMKLAEERKRLGKFDLALMSWTDLLDRIEEVPELAEIYGGQSKRLIETQDVVLDIRSQQDEYQTETRAMLRDIKQLIVAPSLPSLEDLLGPEIDRYRDLLIANKAQLALELLESLRSQRWDSASDKSRFRIITNIAAAKIRLGRKEGADDFISALAYDPEREQAKCNVAYGYLLKDEFVAARDAAYIALTKFPESVNAYALLIAASSGIGDCPTPLSLVPENLHDNAVIAFGFGCFYRNRGDAAAARQWFTRAFEKDQQIPEIQIAYAEQLLGDVLVDLRVVATGQFSAQQRSDLTLVDQLLTKTWAAVKDTEVAPTHIMVAMNLSTVKRLCKDFDAAEKLLDDALRAAPTDDTLKVQRALVAMERGDHDTALRVINGLPVDTFPLVPFIRAEALFRLTRGEEALKLLNDLILKTDNDEMLVRAKRLRAAFTSRLRGGAAGVEAARTFAAEDNSLAARLSVAEALHVNGNADESLERAREIKANLNNETRPEERLALATLFAQLKSFGDAVDIYRDLLPEARDGPTFRNLVGCLVNSDRRAEVLAAISRLPTEEQGRPFYLKAMAATYELAGDRGRALDFYARCLAADPKDIECAFRRILILYHAARGDEVLSAIDEVQLPDLPSAVDLIFVAQIRAEYGQLQRAIEIGYRARRIGFKDPRIHLAYSGLILRRPDEQTNFLNIDRITPDAAFALRDSAGGERWFIMEADRPDNRTGEISPDGPLGRAAMGKMVGERVTLAETNLKVDQRTVSQIKHRAVHALHETMENFEAWFPGQPGMLKFSIREEAGKVDLSDIQRVLRVRGQHATDVEAAYQGGKLPFAVIAHVMGMNPIELSMSFPSDPKTEVVCCVGSADERAQAFKLITSTPKWIIDPLTLVWAHLIGVHEEILALAGTPAMPQSSFDMLDEIIADQERGRTEGSITIGMIGDQIVRTEVTPQAIEAKHRFLIGVRDWVRLKIEVVPAIGTPTKPPDEQLRTALGQTYYDIVLAALGDDRCLLSDDIAFRALAGQIEGVRSTWLQPFLMVARDRGVLKPERYIRAIVKTLDANRTFTAVGDKDLWFVALTCLERSTVSLEFTTLCRAIGKPSASFLDALTILSSVLSLLWSSSIDISCRRNLTFALLGGVTDQQPARIVDVVKQAASLTRQVRAGRYLRTALREWCFGHFIAYPD